MQLSSSALFAQGAWPYNNFQIEASHIIISIIIFILTVAGLWMVFKKAKQPGWAAIIPFYNIYVTLKVAGRPGWWLLLYFASIIPIVGPIVAFITNVVVMHDVSKSFGKDVGTTLLLIFLPFIGFPVLGFGEAKYKGPSALSKTKNS